VLAVALAAEVVPRIDDAVAEELRPRARHHRLREQIRGEDGARERLAPRLQLAHRRAEEARRHGDLLLAVRPAHLRLAPAHVEHEQRLLRLALPRRQRRRPRHRVMDGMAASMLLPSIAIVMPALSMFSLRTFVRAK
jgi:hypothetical protein